MTNSKRHYRVAERTKELENAEAILTRDHVKDLSLIGLLIYFSTVLLSFTVGYLVGKSN